MIFASYKGLCKYPQFGYTDDNDDLQWHQSNCANIFLLRILPAVGIFSLLIEMCIQGPVLKPHVSLTIYFFFTLPFLSECQIPFSKDIGSLCFIILFSGFDIKYFPSPAGWCGGSRGVSSNIALDSGWRQCPDVNGHLLIWDGETKSARYNIDHIAPLCVFGHWNGCSLYMLSQWGRCGAFLIHLIIPLLIFISCFPNALFNAYNNQPDPQLM